MSTNLHLEDRSSPAYYTGLFQTPTEVTAQIMREPTHLARLKAYLKYVDTSVATVHRPGQMLDHKVELLMWMVEHPTARFASW